MLVKSYQDTIGEVSIYSVYDDSKGNLWVCTLGNGLFRINLKDKSVKSYKVDTNKYSISSDNVRDVVNDYNNKCKEQNNFQQKRRMVL